MWECEIDRGGRLEATQWWDDHAAVCSTFDDDRDVVNHDHDHDHATVCQTSLCIVWRWHWYDDIKKLSVVAVSLLSVPPKRVNFWKKLKGTITSNHSLIISTFPYLLSCFSLSFVPFSHRFLPFPTFPSLFPLFPALGRWWWKKRHSPGSPTMEKRHLRKHQMSKTASLMRGTEW